MPARAVEHSCAVPNCVRPGRNQIGVRCRVAHSGASPFPNKRRTDAFWSLESPMYLCDEHSLAGGRVQLAFEPAGTHEIVVESECLGAIYEDRAKPIRQPLEEAA